MSNLPDALESTPKVQVGEDASRRRRDIAPPWLMVAVGICLAGGSYAILVFLILVVGTEAAYGTPALLSMLSLVFEGGLFSILVGAVGVLCTAVVALFVMPVLHLFLWSLQVRANLIWLGAIVGGFVGLVSLYASMSAVSDSLFPPGRSPWGGDFWEVLFLMGLGPGLATVFGQAGGAWGGWRAMRDAADIAKERERASAIASRPEPVPDRHPDESAATHKAWFRFSIRQLLWLTFWFALFLAAAAATGSPFVVLAVFGTWLVFQAATLYVGAKLLRRIVRWRVARRQRRSM
jgi:hypothetical protein